MPESGQGPGVGAIRALLFDLGGVVCHFDRGPRLAALAALVPSSRLSAAEIHIRLIESDFYVRADVGEFSAEEMIARLREMLGLEAGDAAIRAAWTAAFTPNADLLAVVDRLRAVTRVALLTDNPPLLRLGLGEAFPGLLARFDPALFSYELEAMKPSPVVFAAAVARIGLPAGALCLIDDSAANVRGARNAGMQAVQYRDVETLIADLGRLLPHA